MEKRQVRTQALAALIQTDWPVDALAPSWHADWKPPLPQGFHFEPFGIERIGPEAVGLGRQLPFLRSHRRGMSISELCGILVASRIVDGVLGLDVLFISFADLVRARTMRPGSSP